MVKTPRLKAKNPSKHSRAARRVASPSGNPTTKSTVGTDESRPLNQTQHFAGVRKKKSKSKPLTRSQRIRREKGMERAEAVIDQLEIKKTLSKGRSKRVKERSGAWEDINGKIGSANQVSNATFAALANGHGDGDWEDEDEDKDETAEIHENTMQEKEAIQAVTKLQVGETMPQGDDPDEL